MSMPMMMLSPPHRDDETEEQRRRTTERDLEGTGLTLLEASLVVGLGGGALCGRPAHGQEAAAAHDHHVAPSSA
jgi:hypothetical protein